LAQPRDQHRLLAGGERAGARRDDNRVEIRADVENRRSRAIPERLGFELEGVLRQAQRLGETYRDQVVYAVLARDWGKR
jgi:ribosomal-protein-serine acetyltransferase